MKLKLHFNPADNTFVLETDEQVIYNLTFGARSADVNYKNTLSLTQTAERLHFNLKDMIDRLIHENILFRDSRKQLQATRYGIENGWVVSCPVNKPTYKGTYAKVTKEGIEHISNLMNIT